MKEVTRVATWAVAVRSLTGEEATLDAENDTKLDDLKSQYQSKTGTPAEQQHLFFPVKEDNIPRSLSTKTAAQAIANWEESRSQMSAAVVDGLSAGPLHRMTWEDCVGPLAAFQGARAQGEAGCPNRTVHVYMVLSQQWRDEVAEYEAAQAARQPSKSASHADCCCVVQ